MKVEFPVFHVWNYRDTLHTWRKTFLYFMYENMGGYFIHACRISYISCMKIWVCAFVEWIPLLLFFQEKKQHFTLTSNDTNSYNSGLVKCVSHQDFCGNSSQTLICFRSSEPPGGRIDLNCQLQFQSFWFSRFAHASPWTIIKIIVPFE